MPHEVQRQEHRHSLEQFSCLALDCRVELTASIVAEGGRCSGVHSLGYHVGSIREH